VWCSEELLVLLTRGLGGTVSVTITPALFPEQLLCGGQGALEFWNGGNRVRRGVRRGEAGGLGASGGGEGGHGGISSMYPCCLRVLGRVLNVVVVCGRGLKT